MRCYSATQVLTDIGVLAYADYLLAFPSSNIARTAACVRRYVHGRTSSSEFSTEGGRGNVMQIIH